MREYWNGVKIKDIKRIGGSGGSFGKDEVDVYFTVEMKDGSKHTFHYNSREKGYEKRIEIKTLYNEFNNIPETYLFENEADCEINGERFRYGCRMQDNLDNSVIKTNLEIAELRKVGKVRDEGWRHLAYICVIKIENNKVIHGTINDVSLAQLKACGYELEFEHGTYKNGELVE